MPPWASATHLISNWLQIKPEQYSWSVWWVIWIQVIQLFKESLKFPSRAWHPEKIPVIISSVRGFPAAAHQASICRDISITSFPHGSLSSGSLFRSQMAADSRLSNTAGLSLPTKRLVWTEECPLLTLSAQNRLSPKRRLALERFFFLLLPLSPPHNQYKAKLLVELWRAKMKNPFN